MSTSVPTYGMTINEEPTIIPITSENNNYGVAHDDSNPSSSPQFYGLASADSSAAMLLSSGKQQRYESAVVEGVNHNVAEPQSFSLNSGRAKGSRSSSYRVPGVSGTANRPLQSKSRQHSSHASKIFELEDRQSIPPSLQWLGNPKLRIWLSVVPLINGLAAVMYTTVNRAMSTLLNNGLWAAITAYSGASILCLLSAILKRHGVKPVEAFRRVQSRVILNWVDSGMLCSGILGAAYCVANTYIPSYIGSAPWFVFVVVGQVYGSLLIDLTGTFWARKHHIGWLTYLGAAVVVAGALIFQMQGFFDLADSGNNVGKTVVYLILTILSGAVHVAEQCCIGELNRTIHSTRYCVAWSYTSGTLLLFLIGCFVQPAWGTIVITGGDWWKFTGGIFSMFGVLTCSIIGLFVGYNITYCYVIFGQLISSLLFDNFGVLGTTPYHADAWRISGVIIVMLGVSVVQYSSYRTIKEYGTLTTIKTADIMTDAGLMEDDDILPGLNTEDKQSKFSSELSYAVTDVSSSHLGTTTQQPTPLIITKNNNPL